MKLQELNGMYSVQPEQAEMPVLFRDEKREQRIGCLLGTTSRWYFYGNYSITWSNTLKISRVCVDLVGVGISGPIVSIVSADYFLLCEIETDECTGSTSLQPIIGKRYLRPNGLRLPLARRRQAAKLASLKMLETIRELQSAQKGVTAL